MSLQFIRNDITKMNVDIIVNAANESLLGGGGVNGAIHRAAGPKLLEECRTLGGCNVGSAKVTKGYNLNCKYIIHTVGPIYKDGKNNEEELLSSCYKSSLMLAKELNAESIAFPLISAGAYGYPIEEAINIAANTINEFLKNNELEVYLVIFDKSSFEISSKLEKEVISYIDDVYADKTLIKRGGLENRRLKSELSPKRSFKQELLGEKIILGATKSIDDHEFDLDESFTEMLLRKIDEKGISDVECYKKANIDRKLFSKIRSNIHYKVSKPTAIAFAIALELDLVETLELLNKAGFTLSHSKRFDVIIEYFIKNKIYDIITINKTLFKFDEPLLGAKL